MYIRKFKQNATLSSAKTDDFLNVLAKIHKMLHNLVNVLMLQLIQIFFGIIFITFEFFILKLPKTIAVYVKLQIKIFLFFYFQFFGLLFYAIDRLYGRDINMVTFSLLSVRNNFYLQKHCS